MTKISWTDESWNPVVGCTKIAPGCKNCYAEKMACRLAYMGQEKYQRVTGYLNKWTHWLGDVFCDESILSKPLHWRKPRMIFVCSMGDLFHPAVPFEFIDKIMFTIYRSYLLGHQFQLLTKRPKIARRYFNGDVEGRILKMFPNYTKELRLTRNVLSRNLWIGTSISTQADLEKAWWAMKNIPATVRFFSVEPMLEKIKFGRVFMRYIDWVIIGCESGPGARLCSIKDIRDAVWQCKEAGVPVFVKQVPVNGKCSKKIEEWPKDLRIQEYPKP